MRILAFDTETTGVQTNKDPSKPAARAVQLAAKLIDIDEIPKEYPFKYESPLVMKFVIDTGVTIPDGAKNIHGIDEAKCERVGIPHEDAMFAMAAAIGRADAFLGHNLTYDIKIMAHAFYLEGFEGAPFENKPVFDTMRLATPVLKIPKARPSFKDDYRWPKLDATYKFFKLWELENLLGDDFNLESESARIEDEIKNAHDAMIDTDFAIESFFSYCRYTEQNFGIGE